ncbi:hypothetical protein [Chryseobacterium sp. Leaf394]|uniref:hypothetical protein n=1 Tax=Chryseobacterium sp. Leaf394 TaxID=1736361 RepID=UPI0006F99B90|nr:hypothetical protein [Chryseobacterium sp. Leaf394]KQS91555.1 hypothetical protein ASG21_03540 [Chryseobacterium sp. Leaf394]
MKKTVFLILLLFFTKIFGCRCGTQQSIAQDYFEADFVGVITITKAYGDSILISENGFNREFYKAELKFDKIIKGQKFIFLNAFGATDDKFGIHSTDCSVFLKAGEKYMIILKKDVNNLFWVNGCSRMIRLSYHNNHEEESKVIKHYINLFKNLEKYKNQYSNLKFEDFDDKSIRKLRYPTVMFDSDFGDLRLSNPSERIGIYKITTDKNLKIKKLVPIERVGEKDVEIEQLIFKNLSLSEHRVKEVKSCESLLLLYFDDFEPAFNLNNDHEK